MIDGKTALAKLWQSHNLPAAALDRLTLDGAQRVLPSSFAVTAAAQATIAAAALAADEYASRYRASTPQPITVDSNAAAAECSGLFRIDGVSPPVWAKLSGLYRCGDGWLRIHANFDHHRDAALRALDLAPSTSRATLTRVLREHNAEALESAIIQSGGAASALRSSQQWFAHEQAQAITDLPLVELQKIADAPVRKLSPLAPGERPLSHLRVIEFTRILAGPAGCRTLSAYGADVMLINSPALPNIEAIADTSRGKRSAHLDLQNNKDRDQLNTLLESTDVLVQGYRPGALAQFDLHPEQLAERHPGIVCTTLSAYGRLGPWAERRGFDSLVQTAAGFNCDEAEAAKSDMPLPMPVQILDYATGFLLAFGTSVALMRQQSEGGSWHVQVSLAKTAQWLRTLGRNDQDMALPTLDFTNHLQEYPSAYGRLSAIPHAARFTDTPARWSRPSAPPGSAKPVW